MYIYIYAYIYIHIHNTYIYREIDRERERCIHIYIYIFMLEHLGADLRRPHRVRGGDADVAVVGLVEEQLPMYVCINK